MIPAYSSHEFRKDFTCAFGIAPRAANEPRIDVCFLAPGDPIPKPLTYAEAIERYGNDGDLRAWLMAAQPGCWRTAEYIGWSCLAGTRYESEVREFEYRMANPSPREVFAGPCTERYAGNSAERAEWEGASRI